MLNYLRHLFLPHHSNNHRPKILHHTSLSIVIVFFLGLSLFLRPLQHNYPSVLGTAVNISTEELVRLTNEKRKEAGVAPLILNQELSSAAKAKASYMFEKNFWAHVAPDGTTPWYFIKDAGYQYQYAGENLARGFNSAPDVVDAWMASPSHRENLLSPNYKDIGFAVAQGSLTGSETILVVQEFGNKYVPEKENITEEKTPTSPPPSKIVVDNPSIGEPKSAPAVASLINKPLVDSKSTSMNVSIFIISFLIVVLAIDAIIIERKKIKRIFSHNLDHIIFLVILLIVAIIIGRGVIL